MISNHGNTVQKFSEIKGYCFLISVSETHLQRKQSYSLKNSKNICTYHANTESVGHLAGKKKQQRERVKFYHLRTAQGSYTGHGKPGKSWNLWFQFPGLESHGILVKAMEMSWKSNMISENKKAKRQKEIWKITDELETGFNFSRNKDQHVFYAL